MSATIMAGLAPMLIHKWTTKETVTAAFVRLLGTGNMLPELGSKFCRNYSNCNNAEFIEQRLNALLAGVTTSSLRTQEDALIILQNLIRKNYYEGDIIVIEGWALPESLLLANAYNRLHNL